MTTRCREATLSFVHRYEPGRTAATPLLLLHGTGGDEYDLLPLGRRIAPDAALLSPRGQVSESGLPRFFRRLAEGVFDEDDLRQRVEDLARFVVEAQETYGLGAPLAVGFSNGANIAAALMLTHPSALAGAILFRPMMPFREAPRVDMRGTPVLMISGARDPIVPARDAATLAETLRERGASVEHHVLSAGHGLAAGDLELAQTWLAAGSRR